MNDGSLLESVGSISFSDLLLLLEDEVGNHSVHHVVCRVQELLSLVSSSLGVLNIALALNGNASPVHGPIFRLEALLSNTSLVTLLVHLKSLEEVCVILSNWLNNGGPVKLDLVTSSFNDISEFLFVLVLVVVGLS